jgi:glycosyltransferase involved in cell wall biosynthesis
MNAAGRVAFPAPARVSIFMPAFNGASFLPGTIDSLLAQTYRAFELIVVDDGSRDASVEIVEAYAARDPRVRLVRHPANLGAPAARNTGWRAADPAAAYLMDHDCDDLSEPTKLERLVSALDRTPAWSAVGCFCRYIDSAGRRVGWPLLEWRAPLIRRTFGRRNSMIVSATLMRRTLLDQIAPFRAEFSWCDDYDFFARALAAGHRLANLPVVLHAVRLHPRSIGATQGVQMQAQARRVAEQYRRHVPESRLAAAALDVTLRLRMMARQPALLRMPLTVSHPSAGSGSGADGTSDARGRS